MKITTINEYSYNVEFWGVTIEVEGLIGGGYFLHCRDMFTFELLHQELSKVCDQPHVWDNYKEFFHLRKFTLICIFDKVKFKRFLKWVEIQVCRHYWVDMQVRRYYANKNQKY